MIKHQHGGYLRANPKNHEECSYKGGMTDWSKWTIHLLENAKIIQIQNIKTKKYLEIDKRGRFISVSNDGGLSSKFIRHFRSPLDDPTSSNDKEQVVDSLADKKSDDVLMNGGDSLLNGGDSQDELNDDDSKDIELHENDPTKGSAIGSPSGSISERDSAVRLESMGRRGLFLSVHPNDGVYIGKEAQSEHNLLYFLVRGKSDEGLFKKPYLLKQQNTIIIHHAFGGSIRVHPENENIVDSLGDKDLLSRWEALPNDTSTVLQFRNVKSGAFLRIADDAVSCCDAKNDPNTKFKVHIVESPNIVRLESVSFENQFISVRQKGLCIGNGGPHCQMTLYRKD